MIITTNNHNLSEVFQIIGKQSREYDNNEYSATQFSQPPEVVELHRRAKADEFDIHVDLMELNNFIRGHGMDFYRSEKCCWIFTRFN